LSAARSARARARDADDPEPAPRRARDVRLLAHRPELSRRARALRRPAAERAYRADFWISLIPALVRGEANGLPRLDPRLPSRGRGLAHAPRNSTTAARSTECSERRWLCFAQGLGVCWALGPPSPPRCLDVFFPCFRSSVSRSGAKRCDLRFAHARAHT